MSLMGVCDQQNNSAYRNCQLLYNPLLNLNQFDLKNKYVKVLGTLLKLFIITYVNLINYS